MIKLLLRIILTFLYKVEVKGLEHYRVAGKRVLIIANHTSFLDGVLLTVFLPGRLNFAINTEIARNWYVNLVKPFVGLFVLDPMRPFSVRSMIRYLQQDKRVVIFPEGRITMTGSLMKIYHGSGLIADRAGVQVLPIRIQGAQYTPFSRLRGRIRLHWFPKIEMTILPPRPIVAPAGVCGRHRRIYAGQIMSDLMTDMMFSTTHYQRPVFRAVLHAMRLHGHRHVVVEDIQRVPLNYRQLLTQTFMLGRIIRRHTAAKSNVGVMLPGTTAAVISLLAIQSQGRVPTLLNYMEQASNVLAACRLAGLTHIYTSRQFVQTSRLTALIDALADCVNIVYLEDLLAGLSLMDRIRGGFAARFPFLSYYRAAGKVSADEPAIVLFTLGTEGPPKGVVLSHCNLMANMAQLSARIDFGSQDIFFNALPIYRPFAVTAGALLPLTVGVRTFFYPNPNHYRIIPELVYSTNATIMFGTDHYLKKYAEHAHPYDFYSIRYIFAGGERLHADTRHAWSEKFGLRILEGYGATETSPVLSTNTPMETKPGTVGKFLPGIEYQLQAIKGLTDGARLFVKGPNVMQGYLAAGGTGEIQKPVTALGNGWYDTGDLVSIDKQGYVTILGRVSDVVGLNQP